MEDINENVYIIHATNTTHYKIGRSGDVDKRIKGIQTSNANKIKLIRLFECKNSIMLEKHLHNVFEKNRMEGEWFNFNNDELIECQVEAFKMMLEINSKFGENNLDGLNKTKGYNNMKSMKYMEEFDKKGRQYILSCLTKKFFGEQYTIEKHYDEEKVLYIINSLYEDLCQNSKYKEYNEKIMEFKKKRMEYIEFSETKEDILQEIERLKNELKEKRLIEIKKNCAEIISLDYKFVEYVADYLYEKIFEEHTISEDQIDIKRNPKVITLYKEDVSKFINKLFMKKFLSTIDDNKKIEIFMNDLNKNSIIPIKNNIVLLIV
jgi:hypothetical protein